MGRGVGLPRYRNRSCQNDVMTSYDFFTDRVDGPVPQSAEELAPATATALYSLVTSKVDANWFAKLYPIHCEDGKGITSTNVRPLWENARGLIPALPEQMWAEWDGSDGALFDLVEYASRRVSEPLEDRWHDYFGHYELSFDKHSGQKTFRSEVNQLLHRGGTVFELSDDLRIIRVGSPSVQKVIEELSPMSGDEKLDRDLAQAVKLYQSRDIDDRVIAVERLWDAFERLKTIDLPAASKKVSADALLEHIDSRAFRTFVKAEMVCLTAFGNEFTIRHHETNKHPVPPEALDYLFARMGSLITLLLSESSRLAKRTGQPAHLSW